MTHDKTPRDVQIKGRHSEGKEEDSALKYLFQVCPLSRGVRAMEASSHQNAEMAQKVEDKGMIKLVTLLLQRINELENLAYRDSLTNCLNRHALNQVLDRRQLTTVIAVDIPGLGKVNMAAGYEAGDAFIEEVAALLKMVVRSKDIVYRVGGDEFLIVVPGCGWNGANKIKKRIESLNMGLYVGLSVGFNAKKVIEDANFNRNEIKRKFSTKYVQNQTQSTQILA